MAVTRPMKKVTCPRRDIITAILGLMNIEEDGDNVRFRRDSVGAVGWW